MGDLGAGGVYLTVGRRIRRLRERRGTTQTELASRANLTRTSLSNIEAGRQRISVRALLEMAAALNVSPAELLPDLRQTRSTNIQVLVDRGANRDEAEALLRAFRS